MWQQRPEIVAAKAKFVAAKAWKIVAAKAKRLSHSSGKVGRIGVALCPPQHRDLIGFTPYIEDAGA